MQNSTYRNYVHKKFQHYRNNTRWQKSKFSNYSLEKQNQVTKLQIYCFSKQTRETLRLTHFWRFNIGIIHRWVGHYPPFGGGDGRISHPKVCVRPCAIVPKVAYKQILFVNSVDLKNNGPSLKRRKFLTCLNPLFNFVKKRFFLTKYSLRNIECIGYYSMYLSANTNTIYIWIRWKILILQDNKSITSKVCKCKQIAEYNVKPFLNNVLLSSIIQC